MPSIFDSPNYHPLGKVAGKIAINVRGSAISFTKQFIDKLDYPKYVQVFLNQTEKKLGIRPCADSDSNALKFVAMDKSTVNSIRWNNPTFTKSIRGLVPDEFHGIDFTVVGEYLDDENAILFDMTKAERLSSN